MEESKKKAIIIGVIIVCFVAAGVITYKYSFSPEGSGTEDFKGQLVWVKCSNPDCGDEYQMDKKEFLDTKDKLIKGNIELAFSGQTPPLVCKKCGKQSVYEAIKCEKCGLIFFKGAAARGDFADRCPECGYSPMEELRKQARQEARKGG